MITIETIVSNDEGTLFNTFSAKFYHAYIKYASLYALIVPTKLTDGARVPREWQAQPVLLYSS